MTTPRERRYQRTRQAILDEAARIVKERGIDGLSMREIARRIDYSAAGLYEYFDSKEDIIVHVCIEAERRLTAYLQATNPDLPPHRRLVELGMGYLRFAKENPDLFLLQFTFVPQGPQELNIPEAELGQGSFGILLQCVQQGIECGDFFAGPIGAEGLAYSCWSLVHGMAMLQLTALIGMNRDFERADRWALERFVQGLRTEPAPI